MFVMPPIPQIKMVIWQIFEKELSAFSRKAIPGTLFKTCLEKKFKYSQNCPNLLINIVNYLFLYAICTPHVHAFCKNELKDCHLQAMASYLRLVPQPGLTLFGLLISVFLYNNAFKQAKDENTLICGLKKAVKTCNSLPALLSLHDYYIIQLRQASWKAQNPNDTNDEEPILAKELVEDMSLDIFLKGEIHGTPVYVLRANFCFWCAQYYNSVTQDPGLAQTCCKMAVRYLVCADRIQEYSQAAIKNVAYVYNINPAVRKAAGKYDFFELLNSVATGETQVLLDHIKAISGLRGPEIAMATHLGLVDAKKFNSKISVYELAETGEITTDEASSITISCIPSS